MKKYAVAAFLAILFAVMIAFPPEAEQHEKVYIEYTVHGGDTLNSICAPLAEAYGDERDLREITYYVQKHNNAWGDIYPGDKLVIELLVKRGEQLENE